MTSNGSKKDHRPKQKREAVWRIVLLLAGLVAGLVISEVAVRLITRFNPNGPFAHNPVIMAEQTAQFDLFQRDPKLGHRLAGGDFVGVYEKRLMKLAEIVNEASRSGRLIVLNLGDSSTSGWDSRVIVENIKRQKHGLPLLGPFHHYATYSDIMAEDQGLYIINAGIPGYSALQGRLYLEEILKEFKRRSLRVGVVTAYFGNNDAAWNGNLQDRHRIQLPGFHLQVLRIIDVLKKDYEVVPRVSPRQYQKEMEKIIALSREAGATPLLIVPMTPLTWPPGVRAHGLEKETEEVAHQLEGAFATKRLRLAQRDYKQGMTALEVGGQDKARDLLTSARELDVFVPRVKAAYIQRLRNLASEDRVLLVDVSKQIPVDDHEYFVDYCHPIGEANHLIAINTLAQIEDLIPSK